MCLVQVLTLSIWVVLKIYIDPQRLICVYVANDLAQIYRNNISIEDETVQRFAIEIRDLKAKQKKPIKISKAKIGMSDIVRFLFRRR
jgi:hypothetical protein